MSGNLRIAQITDLHIGARGNINQGIPVRGNILKLLKQVSGYKPHVLILSGDLSDTNQSTGAYLWLKTALARLPFTTYFMAGNHDSVGFMRQVFALKGMWNTSGIFYKRSPGGHPLIFLDSSPGVVNARQLTWLKSTCRSLSGRVPLLFMHHPPLLADCAFMDKTYSLSNHSQVWAVLKSIPRLPYIFCGHYHTEKVIIRDKRTVFISPSAFMQIDPAAPGFKILSKRPGWRLIDWDGRKLQTSVIYL